MVASGFLDRTSERATLDGLLARVREGQSSVLVMRGEAGIGKTALLQYAARHASGFHVVPITSVEAEMELPFAGIHQLCAPLLDRLDTLPQPQQDALNVALGLAAGDVPNRFLVGLAVLGLLSAAAEEQPLLCLVEDSQWLDDASGLILGFIARRLLAESVAMVVTVREPTTRRDFDGLPELVLRGLADEDARTLLVNAVTGRLDDGVRDRIVAETGGNPLALLDLPRGMSPTELAGGFELLPSSDLPRQLEDRYLQRVGDLPEATQRLLLLAAAEPIGDAALLWRAADRLGLETASLAPAEDARLVEVGARVRFRHPLVRSAVYRAAAPSERRAAHRALAEATDPDADPDRRAWHRARAAVGVDEAVAAELERSADRAQARGGSAAAAAFLTHATELTPDPAERGRRALAAARANLESGAPDAAHELLTAAEACPLDENLSAWSTRLRAEIVFARTRGSDAPPLLLDAAERFEAVDSGSARETYLEALGAAIFSGRLSGRVGVREAAEAARGAPAPPRPPRATDLLLDGLVTRFTDGYVGGLTPLRRALDAFVQDAPGNADHAMRWFWLPWLVAGDLWDDELWHALATRAVRLGRESGALNVLPLALGYRAVVHLQAGELAEASALTEEADAITRATGNAPVKYASLLLAAWRGVEAEALSSWVRVSTTRPHAARDEGSAGSATRPQCCTTVSAATTPRSRAPGPRASTTTWASSGSPSSRWSKQVPGAARTRRPAPLWNGSPNEPGPPRRTGRSVSRRDHAPSSATAKPPNPSTARRSNASSRPASWSTSPAPGSSTANGCDATIAASTRARSCGPPTTCSATWGRRPSPSAPVASSAQRARRRAVARTRRAGC